MRKYTLIFAFIAVSVMTACGDGSTTSTETTDSTEAAVDTTSAMDSTTAQITDSTVNL